MVFARAPVPGRAKTRLAARLGDWRAARLQARLTLMALRTALVSGCGKVELHGAPQRHGRFFSYCSKRFGVKVEKQKGRDLGERMHNAIATGLRRQRAVLLMGSDCPELRPRDLRRAARLLRGACDAVLAPAEDGGYALIGLRKQRAAVFSRIDWGKPAVYRETLARLQRSGLRWRALRTVWDVDRPEDLARLERLLLARGPSSRRAAG